MTREKNIADKAKEMSKELGPYDLLRNLQQEIERVAQGKGHLHFRERLTEFPRIRQTFGLYHVDIFDMDEHLVIVLELPGIKKEDINLEIEDDKIVVSGQLCHIHDYHEGTLIGRIECKRSMSKVVDLPVRVIPEDAVAKFISNVLEITVPKVEKPKKPVKVKIE